MHRTADTTRSEVGCTRGGQPHELVQSSSENDTAVPADVKTEAAAVAAAHGMSMAALLRELLARVAARDAETLAWLDKARQ